MNKNSKIFIAGHRGLVGSAITKILKEKGYNDFIERTHTELNLMDQVAVEHFFANERPEYVVLAAAKVGGIMANSIYRGQFIYENLMIQNNVIHNAYKYGVKKLLFLGSTCIYPCAAEQPMTEDCLLTSSLEYTNEPYALAKIAGLKMCESYNLQYGTNFIAVMPTNLYGPNDNFNLETGHVLPSIIRKIHLAKSLMENNWDAIRKDFNKYPVENISGKSSNSEIVDKLEKYGVRNVNGITEVGIWGTGAPLREFLWSEDMASACVYLLENIDFSDVVKLSVSEKSKEIRNCHINIGTGKELTIKQLVELTAKTIGFMGNIHFQTEKPDGTMRKLTDSSKLHALGWKHTVEIEDGVRLLYQWYVH